MLAFAVVRATHSLKRVRGASDPSVLTFSTEQARRFLVRRHLLAPPRSLPPTTKSVLAVVERFGSLQFDPLQVPGARNHDLVLHARIARYRTSLCEELLYPNVASERRLFEAYNKSLNLLPTSELPWHQFAWKRAAKRHAGELLRKHRALAARMVARIEAEGPLAPNAFDGSEGKRTVEGYWGAPISLTRHVLDALFMTGRVGIARRNGNRRTYDLVERLFDGSLLGKRVTEDESVAHRLMTRHRAVGLMGERGATELVNGLGTASDRKRQLAALVARGALIEAKVEGLRGTRHVIAAEMGLAQQSVDSSMNGHVAFLAPLDPLMWDRELVRDLFGFDYKWEVYTPLEDRKHGYYTLPILFGDRMVGRIEPVMDRKNKTLRIVNAWWERGFDPNEDGFGSALREALETFKTFVGADRLTYGRNKTCRWIDAMVSER
jgi:uncharacterized protein